LSGQEKYLEDVVEHSRSTRFYWLEGIADPVKLGVVRTLARTRPATVSQIAKRCQASVPTVRRHLSALVAMGIVVEEGGESNGSTIGRPAFRYTLPSSVLSSVRQFLAPDA
jgi:predicted ArsR family transcriptional regulator